MADLTGARRRDPQRRVLGFVSRPADDLCPRLLRSRPMQEHGVFEGLEALHAVVEFQALAGPVEQLNVEYLDGVQQRAADFNADDVGPIHPTRPAPEMNVEPVGPDVDETRILAAIPALQ